MENKNVVDWVEKRPERERNANIRDLIGSTFLIAGYEEKEGKSATKPYKYALVKTNVGVFRTSSGVLIEQMQEMQEVFKEGKEVRVKLIAERSYLRFIAPNAL